SRGSLCDEDWDQEQEKELRDHFHASTISPKIPVIVNLDRLPDGARMGTSPSNSHYGKYF
ncbi:MAG TPA: hypothetical protein VKE71_00405, partial [Candidatus Angelobacter sp.]|nr:hypothetical protein [Candidatus Angelobacter sp.]